MFTILKTIGSGVRYAFCNRTFAVTLLALLTMVAVLTSAAAVNTVTIIDGSKTTTIKTISADAKDILKIAGIDYNEHDKIESTNLDTKNGQIVLNRAFDVNIALGNDRHVAKMCGGTVKDALSSVGIETDDHDIISADLNASVYAGMFVDIISIDYHTETKEELVAPGTDTVYSEDLYVGQSNYTEGTAGVKSVTYSNKVVNGTVTESSPVLEEILTQPVNSVNVVGTKQKNNVSGSSYRDTAGTGNASGTGAKSYSDVATVSAISPAYDFELDENNRPVRYSKVITGRATAYYGGGYTSTGKQAQTGYIAVNPNQIPYGTKLYVISSDGSIIYGYASAEDTGGFVHNSNTVADLYFNSYGACINFGVRQVEIYVLD